MIAPEIPTANPDITPADLSKEAIRIGTLVPAAKAPEYIPQILPYRFESFQLTFWRRIPEGLDLKELADRVRGVLADTGIVISSLGIFGNPLDHLEEDELTREGFRQCIDHAHLFGTNIVAGFAGRLRDKPVPESIDRYKEVFGDLGRRAADKGVKLAFENCPMGGDWQRGDFNIAFNPDAWELMFDALPMENIGLEWEPCHQMTQLIEPMPQLRKWTPKIFHVHGKDATVMWDVIKTHGFAGKEQGIFHRTPGFGDSNWVDIISELRRHGFSGSIDIEGWHDPVYRDDLEITGQVYALKYLKWCRGGRTLPPVE